MGIGVGGIFPGRLGGKDVQSLRTCVSRGNRLHGVRPHFWVPFGLSRLYVWSGSNRWELHCKRGHGIFAVTRLSRDAIALGLGFCPERNRWPKMKKKTAQKEMGDARHLAPLESDRFHDLLPLVEHMSVRKYDDGDLREPGWVTIKTQGAAWLVQIKDPDSCCSFTAVGETLDKALHTAALLLSADDAPWEPDTWLVQAKARKGKKK